MLTFSDDDKNKCYAQYGHEQIFIRNQCLIKYPQYQKIIHSNIIKQVHRRPREACKRDTIYIGSTTYAYAHSSKEEEGTCISSSPLKVR